MENLHKIVFLFENSRNETVLGRRLADNLVAAANSLKVDLLGVGASVETSSDLSWQPATDYGPMWEWYGKIIADTTNAAFHRGAVDASGVDANNEMAARLEALLTDDPRTGSVIRVK